jgi:hypothetical protein
LARRGPWYVTLPEWLRGWTANPLCSHARVRISQVTPYVFFVFSLPFAIVGPHTVFPVFPHCSSLIGQTPPPLGAPRPPPVSFGVFVSVPLLLAAEQSSFNDHKCWGLKLRRLPGRGSVDTRSEPPPQKKRSRARAGTRVSIGGRTKSQWNAQPLWCRDPIWCRWLSFSALTRATWVRVPVSELIFLRFLPPSSSFPFSLHAAPRLPATRPKTPPFLFLLF